MSKASAATSQWRLIFVTLKTAMDYQQIVSLLGDEAESLLGHRCLKIPTASLSAPSANQMLDVFRQSSRSAMVMTNLNKLYRQGRLGGTGYLSIFPVDQGLEHTAAYSFYQNPQFFDPDNIVKLAVEAGCSGVATSMGVLDLVAQKYAEQIPLIAKLNHSEHLTYPPITDQLMFGSVERAYNSGAVGIGATVYFGSSRSPRQIEQVTAAIEQAHRLGMFAIIWCYPRNPLYLRAEQDYTTAVDITAQAIHIAVTMGADLVKQKMPTKLHGFIDLKFSQANPEMYERLLTDHPIDLVRYQVAHAYMGKIGLINSGGESQGETDLRQAVKAAVINKRAGGQGLIMGRKVFKRSWDEGITLLQAVQDVYLTKEITLA